VSVALAEVARGTSDQQSRLRLLGGSSSSQQVKYQINTSGILSKSKAKKSLQPTGF
jgi:hypothetical protein